MCNLLIDSKEIGNHRISIYYDINAECPVKSWDMAGNYVFEYLEYGHYNLSPDCNWEEYSGGRNIRDNSMCDILQRMAADVVEQSDIINYIKAGKIKSLRLIYNRSSHLWELQCWSDWRREKAQWESRFEIEPSDLKAEADYRMELLETFDQDELIALIKECAKDFVIKEWGSCGYSQGDSMRGIAYMTKAQFDKRCGFNPTKYKTWQEQALEVIDGEVKCIEMWAWGDVKGFVLEKKVPFTKTFEDGRQIQTSEWEEVDSCWGYYMTSEELIDEVIAEHDLTDAA